MKVYTVICVLFIATVLGEDEVDRVGAESGDDEKQQQQFQQPSQQYVPSKSIGSPQNLQLNYLIQSPYKFLPQNVASSPQASYSSEQKPFYQLGQQTYSSAANLGKFQTSQGVTAPKTYSVVQNQAQSGPVPYSLATDVSSFKFSSPLVSYSNLGVHSQSLAKLAASNQAQHQQQSQQAPSPQHPAQALHQIAAPQPLIYSQQPTQGFTYKPRAQIAYNVAPQQPSKYVFPQQQQQPQQVNYLAQQQQQPVYPASTQKFAATAAQQFLYSTPQQVQSPQQYTYSVQPQDGNPSQSLESAHSINRPVFTAPSQYQVAYSH